MQRDIAFIILTLVGFALLILLVLSVRYSINRRKGYESNVELDLGSVDELVDDDFDLFGTQDEIISKNEPSLGIIEQSEPIVGTPLADEITDNWPSDVNADLKKEDRLQTAPPKIIAFYIKPEEGEAFVGYDLLQSLLASGLRFGDMSIFHRHEQHSGKGKILFSLAQAAEPGVFDINAIGACRCAGLTLFMQLLGPEHNMTALKMMLETAQQLADDLNGTVTDKNQHLLNAEVLQGFQKQIQAHTRSCEERSVATR